MNKESNSTKDRNGTFVGSENSLVNHLATGTQRYCRFIVEIHRERTVEK